MLLYGPPAPARPCSPARWQARPAFPFSRFRFRTSSRCSSAWAPAVRDLFEQAKQNSHTIIFMDEIDAVEAPPRCRPGGGHDEREQTLNQLLVEMDGFEMTDNIILIAATNRPDILDPALLAQARPLRPPGRRLTGPTARAARRSSKSIPAASRWPKEHRPRCLARPDPGFTGADLSSLINSRRSSRPTVRASAKSQHSELEEGIMRVIAGPEKKTRIMWEKERKITAYHEMGHAIVGHLLPNCDRSQGLVISRGQLTRFAAGRGQVPDLEPSDGTDHGDDLGGRAAEELVFNR